MIGLLRRLFAPSPRYDTTRIEHGFTKREVCDLLGRPDVVTVDGFSRRERWAYTCAPPVQVLINFDDCGLVERTVRTTGDLSL